MPDRLRCCMGWTLKYSYSSLDCALKQEGKKEIFQDFAEWLHRRFQTLCNWLLNVNASAKSVSPLSTNTCIKIVQSQKHQGFDRGSSVYKKINLSPNEFFSVYELIMCHQILQSVKPILVLALPGCCFRQLTCSHSVVCILVEGQHLRH